MQILEKQSELSGLLKDYIKEREINLNLHMSDQSSYSAKKDLVKFIKENGPASLALLVILNDTLTTSSWEDFACLSLEHAKVIFNSENITNQFLKNPDSLISLARAGKGFPALILEKVGDRLEERDKNAYAMITYLQETQQPEARRPR
ncbi:hypothetical protein [Legionella gresilensis]|uniref:hypothetical protein n=1 Tax=Legionella gresilensis TaxID=91823 RepID=UPI0010413F6F|nr:hypothetical protein [Legionella gresilensis]